MTIFFNVGIYIKCNILEIIYYSSNLYHLFANYDIFNLYKINGNCFALAIYIIFVEDL